jgi:hypothetical protein
LPQCTISTAIYLGFHRDTPDTCPKKYRTILPPRHKGTKSKQKRTLCLCPYVVGFLPNVQEFHQKGTFTTKTPRHKVKTEKNFVPLSFVVGFSPNVQEFHQKDSTKVMGGRHVQFAVRQSARQLPKGEPPPPLDKPSLMCYN